jgi:methyl-accepting chemotaxis protein
VSINEIADHTRVGADSVSDPDDRIKYASNMLPRRKFFSDMPDKGLFGIVAIFGFGAICGLKFWDYNNADVVAVLAVAAMVVYGVIAYQMPLVRMRPDRLGDNFYYLGFIYTLASLSAALLQVRAGMNTIQLVGSFGIALVTTIVGIAGRVLFVQLRSELEDIEERVRHDLAATSADLRTQLSASVREFETVRTALLQTLNETIIECDKATRLQVEQVDQLAKLAAEQIKKAFDDNRREAEHLANLTSSVAKNVEEASRRVATIELPTDHLSEQLGAFSRELEALLRRLGAVVEDVARRSVPRRRWYWPFKR